MALAIISPIPEVGRWRRIGFIAASQSVGRQSVPCPGDVRTLPSKARLARKGCPALPALAGEAAQTQTQTQIRQILADKVAAPTRLRVAVRPIIASLRPQSAPRSQRGYPEWISRSPCPIPPQRTCVFADDRRIGGDMGSVGGDASSLMMGRCTHERRLIRSMGR
jgi:hypothetical protein